MASCVACSGCGVLLSYLLFLLLHGSCTDGLLIVDDISGDISLLSGVNDNFHAPCVVHFNWKRRSFYLKLLLSLCGDVYRNPGPAALYLCGQCGSSVSDQDKALCCDKCDKWIHVGCDASITEADYDYLVSNPSTDL